MVAGIVVMTAIGCSSDTGTAPSDISIPITSIVYHRERAAGSDSAGTVTASITFPNGTGRPGLRGCVLAATGSDTFDCGALVAMACRVAVACPIHVSDPAIGRGTVATGLYINGQRLIRIDAFANGVEIGQIRFDPRGQLY
jgi:hypothetical protein